MKHISPLKKLYWLASARYTAWKYPIDNSLVFLGVTGTDGKTTTSSFLYELAKSAGYKPLLMTTVSAKFDDQDIEMHLKSSSFFAYSIKNVISNLKSLHLIEACRNALFLDKKGFEEAVEEHRTTPLGAEIRRVIVEYAQKGADLFILETTSHALDQKRVYGIQFDSIAYTNITSDHLDYHGSWEAYAETKALLIDQLKPGGSVALNKDDEKSFEFLSKKLKNKKHPVITYSVKEKVSTKNFMISLDKKSDTETEVTALKSSKKNNPSKSLFEAGISIFGDYNIYNALAAFSCFTALKKGEPKVLVGSLKKLGDIKGRMNFLSKNPTVIVDFAHTPNAFEMALSSVKPLVKNNGRLWVLFGCPGFRDQYKRPAMGKLAYTYADNVLITSDDPRTESLNEINKQIIQGFKRNDDQFTIETYYPELPYEPIEGQKFIVRFDEPNPNSRRNAIKFAVMNADKNDVILMLGKGHEPSISFGTIEHPWSDTDEAQKALLSRDS